MFFTIECSGLVSPDYIKNTIKFSAIGRIAKYKDGVAEIKLNEYCVSHFKKPLKKVCIDLIKHCRIQKTTEHILVFFNKEDDEIAKLITYGDGIMQGSKILQNAFRRN